MAEPSKERRDILLRPLLIWAALFLLGAISLGYALIPTTPAKPAFALTIVVIQAALVLAGFMRIGRAGALVRMSALIAVVWLSFLFLMTFADLATR